MAITQLAQIPGVYHRRIGEILVTAISDGVLQGSLEVLQNITLEEAKTHLTEAFRPLPRFTSVNTFIIRAGGRTALIDTGCGTSMGPAVGKLPANLAAAGIDHADIDTVILTHVHPDHSNGLADDAGRQWFPAAELVLHEAEYTFWHDDAAMAGPTSRRASATSWPRAGNWRPIAAGPGRSPGARCSRASPPCRCPGTRPAIPATW